MKDLAWDFVGMEYLPLQKFLMQDLIDRKEIVQRTVVIPVCRRFPWDRHSFFKPVL